MAWEPPGAHPGPADAAAVSGAQVLLDLAQSLPHLQFQQGIVVSTRHYAGGAKLAWHGGASSPDVQVAALAGTAGPQLVRKLEVAELDAGPAAAIQHQRVLQLDVPAQCTCGDTTY
jgi:hypothetical protein